MHSARLCNNEVRRPESDSTIRHLLQSGIDLKEVPQEISGSKRDPVQLSLLRSTAVRQQFSIENSFSMCYHREGNHTKTSKY